MKPLTPAQNLIVEFAIASLHFLKEAALEYRCQIDELSEQQLRNYATSARAKK
ncbi:hypothetical protein [Leptolyngbya sp. GGD]|uniref:hypothetical protein n=1 Tax=Leptolyngbya sp. GGD TaxID=2997907 RepID=UPI00227B38DC|nr:hypothetical protein [Leptolyngbya sp. GGD]MCY6493151.1 hypothetical protein [Leptolyngbya sp. GGD]